MTTTQEFKIGDAIGFNTQGNNQTLRQLNELVPLVNDFSAVYQKMRKVPMTNQVFQDAMVNGTAKIIADCKKNNPDAEKISQLPESLQEIANGQMVVFANTLNATREAIIRRTKMQLELRAYEELVWDDIKMKNGAVEIETDKIKERFTLRIKTEAQLNFIDTLNNAKKYWDTAVAMAVDHGYVPRNFAAFGRDGFADEDNEAGTMIINPYAIQWLEA